MNVLPLDKRRQLFKLAAEGATLREIAGAVGIHRETARSYLTASGLILNQSDGLRRHHARRKAESRPILPPWQHRKIAASEGHPKSTGRPREPGSLLSLIEVFVASHPGCGLDEVSAEVGLTSTDERHIVSRRLKALVISGRLERRGSIGYFRYWNTGAMPRAEPHVVEDPKSTCDCKQCWYARGFSDGYDKAAAEWGVT